MNEPGDPTVAPPLPEDPAAGGNPWEQRDRLGFGAALLEGIKLFIVDPVGAFTRTRRQGDFVSPLLFALIVGWFSSLIGRIWQFAFGASLLSFLPPELRDQVAFWMSGSALGLIFEMILWPFFIVIGLFIGAAIVHVSLMIVGGLNQSKSGFEGTFRVISYSHVAQLAQLVPILGPFIWFVWSIALLTIGASSLHDTSRGKALAAVLIPFLACCACLVLAAMGIGLLSTLDQ